MLFLFIRETILQDSGFPGAVDRIIGIRHGTDRYIRYPVELFVR